jgi:PTS system cellobiose-specific IIA component
MNLEEIAFKIIANAGEARAKISEALDATERKDFKKAGELLDKAEEHITAAHKVHLEVVQKEASGEKIQPTLLLIHGMDIMLVAESEKDMAKRIIRMEKARGNS